MSARIRSAWLFAALLSSCSIPLADSEALVSARCQTSADCGASGTCYSLYAGNTCVAKKSDLPGLILEVHPAPGATYGAGTTHLFDLSASGVSLQGSQPAGFVVPFDVELHPLITISPGQVLTTGTFKLPPCMGEDGSIPAKVLFRPIASFIAPAPISEARELIGLNQTPLSATTADYVPKVSAPSFSFDLSVPPNQYDVYVQPLAVTLEDDDVVCTPPPPLFLSHQTITQDAKVNIDMPPPSRLTGNLVVPITADVTGWSLDIVEPRSGFVVSTAQSLVPPVEPGTDPLTTSIPIDLRYYWVDSATSPIIRLRPPEGAPAPRVYWELAGAAIFGDKNILLTLTNLDTTPNHIQASVLDEDNEPVIAEVTIQSEKLEGEVGVNAAYSVTTETGPDGQFEADLLLGSYRILARPKGDPDKALALATWEIKKDDLCCGRVITVGKKATLHGSVETPAGEPLVSASIIATPPLPRPVGFLQKELGLEPVQPERASTFPEPNGSFSFGVDPDPGAVDFAVDFSVRPQVGSGFPWLVRPRVLVHKSGTDLGALTTPYPGILTGQVLDPFGQPVVEAVLRAWLPMSQEAQDPQNTEEPSPWTVIQVAETLTDSAGRYALPLPPSISQ